ncbi:unnamed protein product, partial [Gongylonema pulchrum]|uniref:ABC transporter ATP-binding protein n=1 Tax=Gongylonema pulchrum TaxID=637853 RepID=A0A183F0A4_9BILA
MTAFLDNSVLFGGQGRRLEMHGLSRTDERKCGEETLERYGGVIFRCGGRPT